MVIENNLLPSVEAVNENRLNKFPLNLIIVTPIGSRGCGQGNLIYNKNISARREENALQN